MPRRLKRKYDREARSAREAPENIAAMPTSAAMRTSIPRCGAIALAATPIRAPSPPPIVNNGASVPPEVPLPRAIAQLTNLRITSKTRDVPTTLPPRMCRMLSYPTPNVRGSMYPTTPIRQRADRRPPHPVHRDAMERVLHSVHRTGDIYRRQPDERAEYGIGGQRAPAWLRNIRHPEDGVGPNQGQMHGHRRGRG